MTELNAGDRVSEYLLDEKIGAGSFGQVWKAHHHIWKDEIVAVKIPTDSQFVRNLQKEGLTIHGLRHPNIVRAIGLDPYADVPYLIMEYVDGPSLRPLIEKHPKGLSILAAHRILCGILQALEHAHAHGVIHRDVKPENILINGGGTKPIDEIRVEDVKVTDFGLGHAGEITAASILLSGSLLSEEGRSISGTLAYMAPEQREGGEIDARTDLYAVGIVLFELLCGERPSGSDMPWHIREGLPTWVDHVFGRLYTRREHRFDSATEVLETIGSASVPPIIVVGDRVPGRPPKGDPSRTTCPACQAQLEPGENYCINCGQQLVENVRRCPRCQAYPAPEDRFCVLCGSPLSDD